MIVVVFSFKVRVDLFFEQYDFGNKLWLIGHASFGSSFCFSKKKKRVFEPKSRRLGVKLLGDQNASGDNADVDVG